MSTTDRPYDLLLWGATGVVGRLAAAYCTTHYDPADVSLAIGGRDETRLQALAERLTDQAPAWDEVPTVVGDATDPDRLEAIAGQTAVVCTTVGPYTDLGTPLVAACIETETDYCDLTGEVTWMRSTIDRYHDAAVDAGVKIVHSCGFDSVPADLGTALVQTAALETYGTSCEYVSIATEDASGTVSAGTLASGAAVARAARTDPVARQTLRNPYSLAPPGERTGVDAGSPTGASKDPLRGVWTAPSPMAPVNERVIRRSNALLGYQWGRDFVCTERFPTGDGVAGYLQAQAVGGGFTLLKTAASFGPTRRLLDRLRPYIADAPTREEAAAGHFTVTTIGRGSTQSGPVTVRATIGADLDPGYGATARMLTEAGLCLRFGQTETPLQGGVLTPASAIGTPLADRLRDAGLTATVETEPAGVGTHSGRL